MKHTDLHFETLQLHAGQEQADATTGSRAVPIYQTASYVFDDCRHAADRFALRAPGNIYGRLTNDTQRVLEERMAALEGGVAALAVASGAAAVTYSLQNILLPGDHLVIARNLYGGTFNLIAHTLAAMGRYPLAIDTAIRVSFCADNTPEDVDAFLNAFEDGMKHLQRIRR